MITKRKLYYLLSPSMRYTIRKIYYFPSDLWDTITGKRDKTIPPQGLIFIGPGDFKKIGEHYLNIFKEHCNLLPNHKVLDVGCGIGRIAIPLTKYLNADGSYEGFDIVKSGIDWCTKNISKTHPNFKFKHIDLKNDLYNLKTEESAKNFKFPYEANSFDLVVLTSVFTHMMPEDVKNYLHEINRVLKSNGKCLVTFFILNNESKTFMKSNSGFNFEYNFGSYSLMNKDVKEANIAFEENFLTDSIHESNLIIEKTLYGFWSGRPKNEAFDYQDTMVLTKM